MKRLMLSLLFTNCYLLFGHAQNVATDDINAIKRDTSYIYAEATMRDAVEAKSGARSLLELKIYDWLRSRHPGENADMLVTQSRESWRDLLTRRGNYNRVFAFVRKNDILPEMEESALTEEELTIEEEAPVPELTADEEEMSSVQRFSSIEPYVKGLMEKGRVKAYGKYASLPEDDPCYLFVYNRDGAVVAVLRQTEDGSHFNLRDMKYDNVRNYKNCGAIWFQLKDEQKY